MRRTAAVIRPPSLLTAAAGGARAVWNWLFGPPRVRELPDGSVRVRLLGRLFEAADDELLFSAVSHERERLLIALAKTHEGAGSRPFIAYSRGGAIDLYRRDAQRLEDRLALYNEFLAHLLRRMQQQS